MLIPVFTVYAKALSGANAYLIGLALGAYGFTQGSLQIPLGLLSDKFGRRPVITVGLLLFIIGSLLGAFAHSIHAMIFARSLQGAGAIGSSLMALTADLSKEEERSKTMALLGMSIGLSFMLSIILGPIIAGHFGLSSIFYLTAVLGVIAIILLYTAIPNTPPKTTEGKIKNRFINVLANEALFKLNIGIFFQHAIFTSFFYIIPLLLQSHLKTPWHLYLPLVAGSFVLMIPIMVIAERSFIKPYLIQACILSMCVAHLILFSNHQHFGLIVVALSIFFFCFNLLEALLPSEVSKKAPEHARGTAMGVYSTFQFLGIFYGGLTAGIFYSKFMLTGVIMFNIMQLLLWSAVSNLNLKQSILPHYSKKSAF